MRNSDGLTFEGGPAHGAGQRQTVGRQKLLQNPQLQHHLRFLLAKIIATLTALSSSL